MWLLGPSVLLVPLCRPPCFSTFVENMHNQCNCYLGKNEYFWPQQLIASVKKIEGLLTKRNLNLIGWGWSSSRGWKKLISIVAYLQIWRSKWEIWHIKQWQRKWHQLHLYVPTSLDNKDITIVNQNKKWSFNWVYNLIMRSIFLLFILDRKSTRLNSSHRR